MIKALNLSKSYDNTPVLTGLDLNVKQGSIYGLIGSNGAGKSTLLNILSGVFAPDAGSAKINGEEIFENNRVKSKTAYITDDPFYFNSSTVKEMAEYLNKMYENFSMEKFNQIIDCFPLDMNKKINSFSKGMKRQVSIILAIAQMPDVLLCDESFDGLDPVVRQLVKRLLINEVSQRNMTVIISSHNLREMENLCDTIGVLHDNKIVLERGISDIKDMMHRYQVAFKPMINPDILKPKLDLLSVKARGNILEIVARGSDDQITQILESHSPVLIDKIDLTLEDVFIYEMEVNGYDFSKILL